MFSRSAFRAARSVRVATPVITRATRQIAISASRPEPVQEIVAATEVKSTSYADGSAEKSTITVDQHGLETTAERSGPLSQSTYNSLPKTIQSMTLMNKVVVVTGYVSFELTFCKHES